MEDRDVELLGLPEEEDWILLVPTQTGHISEMRLLCTWLESRAITLQGHEWLNCISTGSMKGFMF